jgi:hypothetical protein
MHRPLVSRIILGLGFALGAATAASAEGSPPLITDDPGTPGNGHWEINVGVSTERRPGERISEAPVVDLNFGVGERLQLTYEVPYLVQRAEGGANVSGLGNSTCSVKWRFLDGGEHGFAMSVFPKIEFNNPGSSSADRGLVDSGSTFILPVQLQKDVGPVTLNLQVGREFRPDGDSWIYGAAVTRQLNAKVAVAAELAGTAAARLDRSALTLDFGLVVDVNERNSFMLSIGRELHNHDEPRANLVGYVGWQLRR